jgi:hypothetical protein
MKDLRYISTPGVLDTLYYFLWKLIPTTLTSAFHVTHKKKVGAFTPVTNIVPSETSRIAALPFSLPELDGEKKWKPR